MFAGISSSNERVSSDEVDGIDARIRVLFRLPGVVMYSFLAMCSLIVSKQPCQLLLSALDY